MSDQWTPEQIEEIKKRNDPEPRLRMKRKIPFLLGLEATKRNEPKAYERKPCGSMKD